MNKIFLLAAFAALSSTAAEAGGRTYGNAATGYGWKSSSGRTGYIAPPNANTPSSARLRCSTTGKTTTCMWF
jgi:hypothetical protein